MFLMVTQEVLLILAQKGYDLCECIGRGSSAECYKVYSKKYNHYFACKIMKRMKCTNNELGYFDNEMRALTHLIHPHILHVYDYFFTANHIFMILEYCENGDLLKHMKEGTISKALMMNYIGQILDALAFLEMNNFAHKDLKPSNIYIDSHKRIKLGDFGLSLKLKPDEDGLHSDFSGSLGFMPPEIYNHQKYNPIQADVWSFGICLYYIVTGNFPYKKAGCIGVCDFFTEGLDEHALENMDPIIVKLLKASLVFDPNKRATFNDLFKIFHNNYKEYPNSHQALAKSNWVQQKILIPKIIAHSRCGSSRAATVKRMRITPKVSQFSARDLF